MEGEERGAGGRAAGEGERRCRVLYVRSSRCVELSSNLECHPERARLVHGLVAAYRLTRQMDCIDPRPLPADALLEYHTQPYLDALKGWERLDEEDLAEYGLEDDCPPFRGVLDYARALAGGTVAAARALCRGTHRVAVHLDGGRHHAQKGSAHGFCFVNDIVLGVLRLLPTFGTVLYIDVDIHHGDAVQDAFYVSDRVCCVSTHKHEPGFYPGTGCGTEIGAGRGKGFTLNLPLRDGLRDDLFIEAFRRLAGGAFAAMRPGCVVLQLGADGLAHDRAVGGAFALTPRAFAEAAREAAGWGAPLLVLGGGGYTECNVARAWAAATGALVGVELSNSIPEHDDLMAYGPRYELHPPPTALRPDENDAAEVLSRCDALVCAVRAGMGEAEEEEQGWGGCEGVGSEGGSQGAGGGEDAEGAAGGGGEEDGCAAAAAAAAGGGGSFDFDFGGEDERQGISSPPPSPGVASAAVSVGGGGAEGEKDGEYPASKARLEGEGKAGGRGCAEAEGCEGPEGEGPSKKARVEGEGKAGRGGCAEAEGCEGPEGEGPSNKARVEGEEGGGGKAGRAEGTPVVRAADPVLAG